MHVIVKDSHISIHDGEDEVFYWDKKEWHDDPDVIVAISNAIVIALTDEDLARETFERIKNPPEDKPTDEG